MTFSVQPVERWLVRPFVRKLAMSASVVIFLGLALRQLLFIDHHAVNILFFDQWDFYTPFFNGEGWWDVFARQHGPHRQGLSFFLTEWLAQMSGWNSRWDAFAVGWTVIAASLCGVYVAIRSGVWSGMALVAAGLIFFNPRQYEIALSAPNLCMAPFPLLLIMLSACCLFIRRTAIRLPLIGVLTFHLIFSGFGIFAAVVLSAMILVEGIQAWRGGQRNHAILAALALIIAASGWLLFSKNYVFVPAVDGFRFPYEKPWEYITFTGLMLANMYGLSSQTAPYIVSGYLVLLVLLFLCAWHGWRMLRCGMANEPLSAVIFLFASCTLVYCASAAVGRVMIGLYAAGASRYVTLMIPAAFAIFLQLSVCMWPGFRPLAALYLTLLASSTLVLNEADWTSVMWLHNGQSAWKAAYLETHDEIQANEKSHFLIYPKPGAIADRLRYLEDHRLNLFLPEKSPL